MLEYDFIIVGGGVAGYAAGCETSKHGQVLLLEMESQPAFHSSGRSASVFIDFYGNEVVQKLTAASRPFMEAPGAFCDTPLLEFIGGMMVTDKAMAVGATALYESLSPVYPHWELLDIDEAVNRVPLLSPAWLGRAIFDSKTASIDVNALLQAYARGMREREADLRTNQRVVEMRRVGAKWFVRTEHDEFATRSVINAAGAWADEVAKCAGLPPVGIVPKKRTVVTFESPEDLPVGRWPIVGDLAENVLFQTRVRAYSCEP